MPPRQYDSGDGGFASAVAGLLGGYQTATDIRLQRKREAQADEDRERTLSREDEADAYRRYRSGFGRAPAGGPPGAPGPLVAPPPAPVAQFRAGPFVGGESTPGVMTTGPGALGRGPDAGAVDPGFTAPAGVAGDGAARAQAGVLGGLRGKVAAALGRAGDSLTTGGFRPHQVAEYGQVGPDRAREEAVADEERKLAGQRDVAQIGADATRYAADQSAGAARFNADLDYRLGLAGLAVTREGYDLRYGEGNTAYLNNLTTALENARKAASYTSGLPSEQRYAAQQEVAYLERLLAIAHQQDYRMFGAAPAGGDPGSLAGGGMAGGLSAPGAGFDLFRGQSLAPFNPNVPAAQAIGARSRAVGAALSRRGAPLGFNADSAARAVTIPPTAGRPSSGGGSGGSGRSF